MKIWTDGNLRPTKIQADFFWPINLKCTRQEVLKVGNYIMLIFSWEEFPIILCKVRSSHQEMFYKKVVIKSFAKFTEKTCARAFFKRSLRLEASNFIVTEATVKAYICTSVHLQMVVSVGVLQNYLPKIFVDKFLQSRQEV